MAALPDACPVDAGEEFVAIERDDVMAGAEVRQVAPDDAAAHQVEHLERTTRAGQSNVEDQRFMPAIYARRERNALDCPGRARSLGGCRADRGVARAGRLREPRGHRIERG